MFTERKQFFKFFRKFIFTGGKFLSVLPDKRNAGGNPGIPAYAVYTKESITFYTEDKAPDIIAKLNYPQKTEGKLKTLTVTADKDGKKNEIITITADFEFEGGEKAKYVWVSGDEGYTYSEEFSYKKGETPAKGQ